jgi:hypothetical protein
MDALLEMVAQKPLAQGIGTTTCPFCEMAHQYTLVGGIGEDPNHHWVSCRCRSCGKMFTKEYKRGNVWYTNSDAMVLRGVPSCFENYTYTCATCGADVERHYRELDGVTPLKGQGLCYSNGPNGMEPQQRCFYECDVCDEAIEYPQEYYRAT